jgi:hypothetical protein
MPLPNNISNRTQSKLDTQETQHNFEYKGVTCANREMLYCTSQCIGTKTFYHGNSYGLQEEF